MKSKIGKNVRRSMGLFCAALFLFTVPAWGQSSETAVLSGTVTADRDYAVSDASGEHIPALQAVRVRARETQRHVTYTVFTLKGKYHIYNLPPGTYQVSAIQDSFVSDTPTVEVKAGDSKQVDVAMHAHDVKPRFQLVDFDKVFPPSPARDIAMKECAGCHGFEHIPWQRMGGRTEDAWRAAEGRMFDLAGTNGKSGVPQVNPAGVSEQERDQLIQYWADTFSPDQPARDIKLNDLPLDEEALSRAVYVEYEFPPALPGKEMSAHDVYPSRKSSTIWVAQMSQDDILGMDTRKLDYPDRWKRFVIPDPNPDHHGLHPHGITETPDGHVYTADIEGSLITELDPRSGEMHSYPTPTRSTPHTIVYDSKGNVWFTEMQGASKVAMLDPETKKITEWDPAPAYKNAHYYGIVVDKQDRVWAVGMTAHIIVGYDQHTKKWSVYPTPTQPSGPRRPTVDADGNIWFSEHIGQAIGELNPSTGKITEYKDPFNYGGAYEIYADHKNPDIIWVTYRSYGTITAFNRKTRQYVHYPLPFPDILGREHPGTHGTQLGGLYPPKIEQADNGTIWFSGLAMHYLYSFRPNGNVPSGTQAAMAAH